MKTLQTLYLTVTSGKAKEEEYYICRLQGETFRDLQSQFLTKFDHYIGSIEADAEKPLVKQMTEEATDMNKWIERINKETDWRIAVQFESIY